MAALLCRVGANVARRTTAVYSVRCMSDHVPSVVDPQKGKVGEYIYKCALKCMQGYLIHDVGKGLTTSVYNSSVQQPVDDHVLHHFRKKFSIYLAILIVNLYFNNKRIKNVYCGHNIYPRGTCGGITLE